VSRDFLPTIGGCPHGCSVGNPIGVGEPAISAHANEGTINRVGSTHVARVRTPGHAGLTIVVTDDHGKSRYTIPLFRAVSPGTQSGLRLGDTLRDTKSVVVSSMVALAIVGLAATTASIVPDNKTYRLASAPNGGAGVAVRFVARTKPNDIAEFLAKYKGAVVGEPRSGGFYRIRIFETAVEQDVAKLVALMAQEEIVEFAAVQPQR
jgi:hypothetical protein